MLSVRVFPFFHSAPPASRLGMGKKLEGDTARTADISRQNVFSMQYDVVLSNKSSGEGREKVIVMVFVFPSKHYGC